MRETIVAGKTIAHWVARYPLIQRIISLDEVFWTNPQYGALATDMDDIPLDERDLADAQARWLRFAPYISKRFAETIESKGLIESPLVRIPKMHRAMEQRFGQPIRGSLLLKCDSHLPIAGSIKARGGIYEVLKHAETLAMENGLVSPGDDYAQLDRDEVRAFFSQYAIAVGSTGNLGLSIGIMGACMGFKIVVHMSAEAKQWKKDLLISKGVTVIEHASDYGEAVAKGRKQAQADAKMHFIDDENSTDLFLGYAVAGLRVKKQMDDMAVKVDADHPLFVYLPCGVGGAPGGLTFGLKAVYGKHVHCFFAEPTHSPGMLLGLLTRLHAQISVRDFGIDNRTEADGLAVGRPSGFVGRHLEKIISGVYTVEDDMLHIALSMLADTENIDAEPSAMAAMPGPLRVLASRPGRAYLKQHQMTAKLNSTTHLIWSTGGSMVPEKVKAAYYRKGKALEGRRELKDE